jgi:hypothetical protein
MIDITFTSFECPVKNPEREALQQYVRALLARQQALDVLETVHGQINQVWSSLSRLLTGSRMAAKAAQAVRAARAARAEKARRTYRSLAQRREESVLALQQAEIQARSAWQGLVDSHAKAAPKKSSARPLNFSRQTKSQAQLA